MEQLYLLTICRKQVLAYVSADDLLGEFSEVCSIKHLGSIKYTLEFHGKYNQLHLHSIVVGGRYFNFRLTTSDYRYYFTKFQRDSFGRVWKYLHKFSHDTYRQQQILAENYYNYNYGFQPEEAESTVLHLY